MTHFPFLGFRCEMRDASVMLKVCVCVLLRDAEMEVACTMYMYVEPHTIYTIYAP